MIMYIYIYMFVKKIRRHQHTRAYTRTQARGATPELRRVSQYIYIYIINYILTLP